MSEPDMQWIELAARGDQQGLATAFVAQQCDRHAVVLADALRLTLVVEELFTNVITHGCAGQRTVPVRIGLHVAQQQILLHFEDAAIAFDPRSRLQQEVAALDADAHERPIGQLGLPLVFGIASQVDYERRNDWNRLRLTLQRTI